MRGERSDVWKILGNERDIYPDSWNWWIVCKIKELQANTELSRLRHMPTPLGTSHEIHNALLLLLG